MLQSNHITPETLHDALRYAKLDWYQNTMKAKSGTPLPVLANVMMALRFDPDLQKMLALDEMAGSVMLMHRFQSGAGTRRGRPSHAR